ncbi:MAG: tetratricopeptide repeat protein [Acidobacteria bacterium]|nr:tetratricopeptide repeat protein [Acidobacteriota bacterium]MBI3280558.1 tetratricopeptide repeat protein [Acidobacteriota bacterium]
MKTGPAFRHFVSVALALLVCASMLAAQEAGAQAPPASPPGGGGTGGQQPGAPGGAPGVPGTPGRDPGMGRQPQQQPFPEPRQQMPEMQRMIFLSGKVVMDDGTPPPEQVVIERVCNGMPRPEGYTDSKGRFSIQLGGNNAAVMMDASVSSAEMDPSAMGSRSGASRSPFGQRGISERDLMGCDLRASLAGFRSDVVNLSGRRAMDNPDIGTIVLHRLAKVEGFTFSATTAFAPKDARKAFEKGRQETKKKKFANAEKELKKAVGLYPKFAVAWYELGTVYQQQNKLDDARNAYQESLKADPKLVTPYAQLARLAATDQKWREVADYTSTLLRLNPFFSPDPYFYSAVANYNLQKFDVSEEHVREALKMDPQRFPQAHHLLAALLANKHDYKGAADAMRTYIKLAPNAANSAQARQQLAEIERLSGAPPAKPEAQ